MKHAALAGIAALAAVSCADLGPRGDRLVFPPDAPGARLASALPASLAWPVKFNPGTGHLLYADWSPGWGTNGFAIARVNAATLAVDTIAVSQNYFDLQFAAASGRVFYSILYQGQGQGSGPYLVRRVPDEGGPSFPVEIRNAVINPYFFISDDGGHVVTKSNVLPDRWTVSNLSSLEVEREFDMNDPVDAISPDASEVLTVALGGVAIKTLATGAVRIGHQEALLPGQVQLMGVAWINGVVHGLLLSDSETGFDATRARTLALYEWSESNPSAPVFVGSLITKAFGSDGCVAWSPTTHTAVLMADSLQSTPVVQAYRAHRKIVKVKGGVTTSIGSLNIEEGDPVPFSCALSADATRFAYRKADAVHIVNVP